MNGLHRTKNSPGQRGEQPGGCHDGRAYEFGSAGNKNTHEFLLLELNPGNSGLMLHAGKVVTL